MNRDSFYRRVNPNFLVKAESPAVVLLEKSGLSNLISPSMMSTTTTEVPSAAMVPVRSAVMRTARIAAMVVMRMMIR